LCVLISSAEIRRNRIILLRLTNSKSTGNSIESSWLGKQRASAKKKQAVLRGMVVLAVLASLICGSVGKPESSQAKSTAEVSLSQPLTLRWRYASNSTLGLTPAADNEHIYLPLAGGSMVSLNASDGELHWRSEVGGEFSASPAADRKAVYVAAETTLTDGSTKPASGSLRALGHEAGVTLWLTTLPVPIRGSLSVSDHKIFAGTGNGGFYSFDKITGEIDWLVQFGSAFNCTPAVYRGTVYVGSEDGSVIALEETTGRLRWRYATRGPVRGPIAAVNDTIYFGSGDGYVYAVGEADGHLRWRSRTGAGVQAVKSVSRGLLVASFDNFVYLLTFPRGKRLWKRQLPGRISAQPVTAADGALFTPLSGDAGVVLSLRDGKPVNSLPTGEGSNTAASPLIVEDAVFLTTDQGLLAFAQPGRNNASTRP
jgi:eukaryotic-like serine/threonine-protein kinase